jgi:endonuclease YncB( thermonuclease family)
MRSMRLGSICVVLAALALAGCGPDLKGLEKGETGEVARVRDGDTLELKSGLVVHLAELEAPRRDQPGAADARAALERLAVGLKVQLAYGGRKRAREAAIAHVFAKSEGGRQIWLQQAMLLEGRARVHTRADNVARADELLTAEAAARGAKRGLWADPAYAVKKPEALIRTPEEIEADPVCAKPPPEPQQSSAPPAANANAEGAPRERRRRPSRRSFELVEGRVVNVAERERAVFLNFGSDVSKDFAVLVDKEDIEAWPGGLAAIKGLQGKKARVRGYVPLRGKPLMRMDHAALWEALPG